MNPRPSYPLTMALGSILLVAAGCGLTKEEKAEFDLYKKNGLAYYQGAQYDKSKYEFEKALEIDPDDEETLLMLAWSYLMQSEGDGVLPAYLAFEVLADDQPEEYRSHLGLGVSAFLLGTRDEADADAMTEEAYARLDRFEAEHPDDRLVAMRRIREEAAGCERRFQETGNRASLDEAKRLFGEALRLEKAWMESQEHVELREVERLLEDSEKLRSQKDNWYATAQEPLEKALELEEKNPFLIEMVAFNFVKRGADHYDEALKYLDRFIEYRMVDLTAYEGNLERARHHGVLSVAEETEVVTAITNVGAEIRRARSFIAYMHYVLADSESDPARSEAHLAQAEKQILEASLIDPYNPSPHLNQAHVYWKKSELARKQGDYEDQVKYLQQAKNEIFQFTTKNQFQGAELNVLAKETATWLELRMKEIEDRIGKKEAEAQGGTSDAVPGPAAASDGLARGEGEE